MEPGIFPISPTWALRISSSELSPPVRLAVEADVADAVVAEVAQPAEQ
jgi:hypothetical protein